VNEKQRKLLRYFVKYTGKQETADKLIQVFDLADHKTKGKITSWLKRTVVTIMAIQRQAEMKQEQAIWEQLKGTFEDQLKQLGEMTNEDPGKVPDPDHHVPSDEPVPSVGV
jgi:hypothetical protein